MDASEMDVSWKVRAAFMDQCLIEIAGRVCHVRRNLPVSGDMHKGSLAVAGLIIPYF